MLGATPSKTFFKVILPELRPALLTGSVSYTHLDVYKRQVIGDVKRGDIGSTSAAYATGHLGRVQIGSKSYSTFDEDFATVNPYPVSYTHLDVYKRQTWQSF